MTGGHSALSSLIPVLCSSYCGISSFHVLFGVVMVLCSLISPIGSVMIQCVKRFVGLRSGSLGMSLPHRRRSGIARSSSKCFKWLRRRHLHVCLVRHCRSRLQTPSLLGFRMHQHQHWRRRKERWRCTYKVKCHELKLRQFLTPLETGRSVWNRRRCVDSSSTY